MRKIHLHFVILISAYFFIGCSTNSKKDDLSYVPLSEYRIDSAKINEGDNLQIIGYSGGKKGDNNNVYYFEFLVVNKNSGDTLRILTPIIFIDQSGAPSGGTYTSPISFDGSKGVFEASYLPLDSARRVWVNLVSSTSSTPDHMDDIGKNFSDKIVAKQWVTINNSLPMLQNQKYKAVIGVLKFDQIPW